MKTIERAAIDVLFSALERREFKLVGPKVQEGTIVYDELHTPAELPVGWIDEQDNGQYRLKRGSNGALFGYVVGPQSWKKFLYPPATRLWSATRKGKDKTLEMATDSEKPPKYAFIGVRPCELHAIAIQDRIFMQGKHKDAIYRARRERVFIVAVNCTQPGHTCFCASMNTGPRAAKGYDLVLTEVLDGDHHYFGVELGTEAGTAVMDEVPHQEATDTEKAAIENLLASASEKMGRAVETTNLKEILQQSYEHPRWDAVSRRCLTCANCTMVCPTCFCATVEDVTDLTGKQAERWRKWDSCFTMDFSYVHGGSLRASARARYRQWLTHKFATWLDQFGTSGCVGCGRCITWCPAGIDVTEEVRAIRGGSEGASM